MKKRMITGKILSSVAVILTAVLAAGAFAGCNDQKVTEISTESGVQSAEQTESSTADEASEESPAEQSEKTSEESAQESSQEASIEKSKQTSEVSEQESSEDESEYSHEESDNKERIVSEKKYSMDDVIRYGELNETIIADVTEWGLTEFPIKSKVCIVEIKENKYCVYVYGNIAEIDSTYIDLYPEDYVPDFSDPLWLAD